MRSTPADFAFPSLNLHNVVYMYLFMYVYLFTYYLHTNLLTLCSCRFVQMFFLILCGLNVNVTLHVGSFTTSKKGVKTLLFPQTFYELFLNFTRFSLYNFLTNIFTVCHKYILPISGLYFYTAFKN